jgi:hypothetical protein
VQYLETTIADGRDWGAQGYDRSEYSIDYTFQDGQKYVMEWKGMIPSAWPTTGDVTVMMQVHMNNNGVPASSFEARNGRLVFVDFMDPQDTDAYNGNNPKIYDLGSISALTGVPITLRITLVSSLDNGYLMLEKDGVKIMERSGRTTLVSGGDWLKDATLYDWGKYWVDPAQASRGRSYSLLTEYSKIWRIAAGTATPAPAPAPAPTPAPAPAPAPVPSTLHPPRTVPRSRRSRRSRTMRCRAYSRTIKCRPRSALPTRAIGSSTLASISERSERRASE